MVHRRSALASRRRAHPTISSVKFLFFQPLPFTLYRTDVHPAPTQSAAKNADPGVATARPWLNLPLPTSANIVYCSALESSLVAGAAVPSFEPFTGSAQHAPTATLRTFDTLEYLQLASYVPSIHTPHHDNVPSSTSPRTDVCRCIDAFASAATLATTITAGIAECRRRVDELLTDSGNYCCGNYDNLYAGFFGYDNYDLFAAADAESSDFGPVFAVRSLVQQAAKGPSCPHVP